ncbi:MAG: hypothetical protein LBT89_10800 [Planctomycetaceae bacterium]|jgi:hypothetical protein|nr:hypothetical protein [Planctomycetaceae bacterium]
MLDVYYTIDTEFWSSRPYTSPEDYESDFDRDIHGKTARGSFGLDFQLKRFAENGLKAVCFTETLHSLLLGIKPLQRITDIIKTYGHDTQLHCHTEWLQQPCPWQENDFPAPLQGRSGQHIRHFSEGSQAAIIAVGVEALQTCGVPPIWAFRAGNYGADNVTLRACSFNGIIYDSSYNYPYLKAACRIETPQPLLSPQQIEGIWEIPIPFFDTFRGPRHVQVAAASNSELEAAMMHAYKSNWKTFVIVSHSFELIHRDKKEELGEYNGIQVRRFERLCEFLKQNSDKFRTRTFTELANDENGEASLSDDPANYESHAMSSISTIGRLIEHARQRWAW